MTAWEPRTVQERRRALARMRRHARHTAEAPDRTSVRVKVSTAEGPRWARVSADVAAVLRTNPDRLGAQDRIGGLKLLSLAGLESARVDVEAPAASGIGALMAERPLGLARTPQWAHGAVLLRGIGDRRAGNVLTGRMTADERAAWLDYRAAHMAAHAEHEAARAIERARLAWWQRRAAAEAQRAAWRLTRRVARPDVRRPGIGRAAAARADAGTLTAARRQAAFARQRAALTAAAIADGTLTND